MITYTSFKILPADWILTTYVWRHGRNVYCREMRFPNIITGSTAIWSDHRCVARARSRREAKRITAQWAVAK